VLEVEQMLAVVDEDVVPTAVVVEEVVVQQRSLTQTVRVIIRRMRFLFQRKNPVLGILPRKRRPRRHGIRLSQQSHWVHQFQRSHPRLLLLWLLWLLA
jgi:hypothetical protein